MNKEKIIWVYVCEWFFGGFWQDRKRKEKKSENENGTKKNPKKDNNKISNNNENMVVKWNWMEWRKENC